MSEFIASLNCVQVRMLANAVFGEPLVQLFSRAKISESGADIQTAPSPDISNRQQHSTVFSLDSTQRQWLSELDKNPDPLLEHLNCLEPGRSGRIKLGIYHEQLWSFFLQYNPNSILLASNLKISTFSASNGITTDIGEFDFLYQHREWGLTHLEVASKYYLADNSDTEQWHNWLGPGRRDRLDIKLEHCLTKQINLADYDATKADLRTLLKKHRKQDNSPAIVQKHIVIGGKLFYPARCQPGAVPPEKFLDDAENIKMKRPFPHSLNERHQRGLWWTRSEWQRLCASQPKIAFRIIQKPYWIDSSSGLWIDKNLATKKNQSLGDMKEPVFISYCFKDHSNRKGCGFIVPDNWATQ